MKLTKETWIILTIGVADLVTTILFIHHYGAQEANPLFDYYWKLGLSAFVLAKSVCVVGPLLILEWARRHKPHFVRWASRGAILAYLMAYGIGVARLNTPPASAQPPVQAIKSDLSGMSAM